MKTQITNLLTKALEAKTTLFLLGQDGHVESIRSIPMSIPCMVMSTSRIIEVTRASSFSSRSLSKKVNGLCGNVSKCDPRMDFFWL